MIIKEKVPEEQVIDNTIALAREGYLFIKNRMELYHTNIFETHLMGQKVICISGEEAVKIFYDQDKFQRKGAAPKRIQKTLFGMKAIQTMDGKEHAHRKALFMSLMTLAHEKKLSNLVREKWESNIKVWQGSEKVVIFEEAKNVLCSAACEWAGVPLQESEIRLRAEDFSAMVYAFGAVGPEHWRGRRARGRAEKWISEIIEQVRGNKLCCEPNSPLHTMAFYKELDGKLLDVKVAAVELINLLRPIVAISTFITFSALALHENPQYKRISVEDNNKELEMFVQEVRRFYPFGPFVGARVRRDFQWENYEFSKGTLVLLDIYGTNHDHKIWKNPNEFAPERFRQWQGNLFDFIPQGGGNPSNGHRCAGEGATIEIMKVTLDFLVNKIQYEVPEQDLSFSLVKMPTLPESGFIMCNIKEKI